MTGKPTEPRRNVRAVLIGGGIGLALCSPVLAQSARQPADSQDQDSAKADLAEVLVTAQKRSEKLEDVPISITVVDAARLESAGAVGFQNLDQVAVGTHVSRVGIYFQPSIRGISTQVVGVGQENNVAVYVDGFYQPSQVGINTDFNNIKSIQILKGPQGTLFGRNATGGAILIDTLDPSFTATGKLSASYGRFNETNLQGYFSNGLSDTVAFDVAGYYKRSDGYIKDIAGYDTNPTDDRSVRSKILFTPGDEFRLTATLEYQRMSDAAALASTYFDRQLATFLVPGLPLATQPDRTSLNFGPRSVTSTDTAAIKSEYDFSSATVSSYTRYSHEGGAIDFDLDGSTLRLFEQQLDTRQDTFTQEINLGSSHGGVLDWVTGAFLYANSAQYYNNKVLLDATRNLYSSPSNSEMWSRAAALYGDATYHLPHGFSLTGGLRYSWEKRTFLFAQPVDIPLVDHVHKSWDSLTPRAVLQYELAPDSNVYTSFSKGFKSGTFNTTSPDPTPVSPEKVTAYEIGYKVARGGVRFDTAAYYYDYTDLQVSALTILNNNQEAAHLTNAAAAEIYGIEAQLTASPLERLDLSVSAAYNHARYTNYQNASISPALSGVPLNGASPVPQDWSGLRIIGAPDVTANLGVKYAEPTTMGRVILDGNLYYSSAFAPNYDDQLNGSYRYQQGAYVMVNLSATLALPGDHWRLSVWGRNVTDAKVKINFGGNPFGDLAVYSEPAVYGVRAEYSF
jgi:iron complex outermembrane recepter protein